MFSLSRSLPPTSSSISLPVILVTISLGPEITLGSGTPTSASSPKRLPSVFAKLLNSGSVSFSSTFFSTSVTGVGSKRSDLTCSLVTSSMSASDTSLSYLSSANAYSFSTSKDASSLRLEGGSTGAGIRVGVGASSKSKLSCSSNCPLTFLLSNCVLFWSVSAIMRSSSDICSSSDVGPSYVA